MKRISFFYLLALLCFLSCQKDNKEDTSTFEVKDQVGKIIFDFNDVSKLTKDMIKDRYLKDIDFKITIVTTVFDEAYYITKIEYELANNLKTNFLISNSPKFQSSTKEQLSLRDDTTIVRIHCTGTCQCGIQGSGYVINCSCGETTQPSGTTCNMVIEYINQP